MNDIKFYLKNLKYSDKITDKGLVIESPPSSDNVKAVYCSKWTAVDVRLPGVRVTDAYVTCPSDSRELHGDGQPKLPCLHSDRLVQKQ